MRGGRPTWIPRAFLHKPCSKAAETMKTIRHKEWVSVQLQTETHMQSVDKPNFPDVPALEPLFLEERGEEGHRDEDNSESRPKARWWEYFPHQAGRGLRREPTMFESLRNAQVERGEPIWGTFSDEGDWEFARWILNSGTTHASTDELLELKKVSKTPVVEYRAYQSVTDSRSYPHLVPQ